MIVAAALLALSLSAAAPSGDAIAGLAKVYDSHPLIFMGEWHRNAQQHVFLRELISDPRFLCRTDDIVIESGNARLQPLADAWASGKDVSEADLVSMYRETQVPFVWNAPMYRQFYETVRDVNMRHVCPHPVRLLLGDPSFDWAKIENAEDLKKVQDRDEAYADVIDREVLAKKHRALLISGIPHALRKLPPATSADDGFTGPTVAQIIEQKHPGAMFVVALVTTPAAAETMQMPPPPSFRIVRGSALAKINFALIAPATKATPVIINGKHEWKLDGTQAWPPMGEFIDGVLYLGGDETRVFPSPSTYLEPTYQKELRRRMRILKVYNGQDFEPILDDLIKEASSPDKAASH